jgi:hypothetical protein
MNQLKATYATLRTQFAEASHQYSQLQHTLVAILNSRTGNENISKLEGPPQVGLDQRRFGTI